MQRKIVYMKDQPWHNKPEGKKTVIIGNPKIQPGIIVESDAEQLVEEVKVVLAEVELSEETPAEVVKTPVKKKKRRTKAQMQAAKDKDVQTSD